MHRVHSRRSGHRNGALEEAVCQGRCHQVQHGAAPGGFAHDRDLFGIAPKGGDVLVHPFQGSNLVQVAVIAQQTIIFICRRQGRVGKEAKASEAIVEADDNQPLFGKGGAVIYAGR